MLLNQLEVLWQPRQSKKSIFLFCLKTFMPQSEKEAGLICKCQTKAKKSTKKLFHFAKWLGLNFYPCHQTILGLKLTVRNLNLPKQLVQLKSEESQNKRLLRKSNKIKTLGPILTKMLVHHKSMKMNWWQQLIVLKSLKNCVISTTKCRAQSHVLIAAVDSRKESKEMSQSLNSKMVRLNQVVVHAIWETPSDVQHAHIEEHQLSKKVIKLN